MTRPAPPDRYKWVVLGITTIGVLMFAIDGTVVILALPAITADLHSNLVSMIWVLMAYIFASTALLLAFGRVADIYGRVRLYNLGFAVFTIGSLFAGLSRSDLQLIAARVVQGAGGALMIVNALAILTEVFPPWQRGTALGFNAMTFGAGAILGPILGGVILAVASWPWVFLINLPIGIVGTFLSYRLLRPLPRRRGERLDLVGTASFSVSLLALLLGLTEAISLGFTAPPILALFGVFVAGLAFFIWWERRASCPALDLRLFRSRVFDFSVSAALLQALAIFAVQLLVVLYFQVVRGYSPLSAALLLLPLPVALALISAVSGRLSDRIGARIPATAGLLFQAAGVLVLSTPTLDTPYPLTATGLVLTGLGGGLFFSPNTSAAMTAAATAVPGRLGVASATLATLRNTGQVTSFALALAVAAASLPKELALGLFAGTTVTLSPALKAAFVEGMRSALHVSLAICLVAAGFSYVRGPEERR
jgi:EmrB/QacA subfamily drug resistance transporter